MCEKAEIDAAQVAEDCRSTAVQAKAVSDEVVVDEDLDGYVDEQAAAATSGWKVAVPRINWATARDDNEEDELVVAA